MQEVDIHIKSIYMSAGLHYILNFRVLRRVVRKAKIRHNKMSTHDRVRAGQLRFLAEPIVKGFPVDGK